MNIRRSRLAVAPPSLVFALALLGGGPPSAAAEGEMRTLGEIEVALYGLSAGVEPASPIVPKQTASGLRIVVRAGGNALSSADVARLLGGPFEVHADLSGPGLPSALQLPLTGSQAIPSPDPLVLTFPGLPRAGDYEIANIRLVRGGHAVLDVLPRRVTLRVIDQILVTSVVTRPLTLDEIRERGVLLDSRSYLGFEFAITLRLDSQPVQFRFPAVFDRQGVPLPMALQPPPEPLRSVISAPQLVPVLLRPKATENEPDGAPAPDYGLDDLPGGGSAPIPSLLVIPGSVGYLKQFFSAQLLVGNGAPAGSGLEVRDVRGTLRLPPGADGQLGTEDDPLALPDLEGGPQSAEIEVLTEGGVAVLQPGEFGRAELTLRGEREGRHDVDFDIRARLDGLPVGPVELEGRARGAVLVRNAYFDVTFTVPTVVRADEEFSVYATVTNIGQGTGQNVKMTLDPARLSGAQLLSPGTQTAAKIARGGSHTFEFRFRGLVTGEVVASYLRFDTTGGVNVTGRLNFALGVGERRVALSPDTLVLPSSVRALPPQVVAAAMRVLGQAWSAANAHTLPPGVARPSQASVFRKGLAVAEAGLRVELGQTPSDALRDLLLDLHGGEADPGFDQVLRETSAGRDLDAVLGAALEYAAGLDVRRYEEDAAEIASSGPPFLSFSVDGGNGTWPAGVALVDGLGRRTDLAGARGVPSAFLVTLGDGPNDPRLGWVSALDAAPYAIEITGHASGELDLSLTVPGEGGEVRRVRLSGFDVDAGARYRLVYDPSRPGAVDLQTDATGDGVFETRQPLPTSALYARGPRLLAATTIGPETLDGASVFGTYAALLFDRTVGATDAADVANYEIPDNSVVGARRQLSGRLVFVAFEQPEGPLVPTTLRVSGLRDERGNGGSSQEVALGSRLVQPGAVVSGRVLEADGTPVSDAVVTYSNSSGLYSGGRLDCTIGLYSGIAAQRTDGAGRFQFRYVAQSPCGAPFRIETQDPHTGALRGVKAHVRVPGQHLALDLVLIGHGTVTGTVRHANGQVAAGARVRVVSVTDSQIAVVTSADETGTFTAPRITVGAVTITAVAGANLGRAAGRLDAAGGTVAIDVTLDGNVDLTGIVRKLEGGLLTPVPGVDVVYFRQNEPLGVSVTDADGRYTLRGVPAGPYRLDAGLNQRDKTSVNGNSVAGQSLVQNLVIEVLDYSNFGTVKGTVRRADGSFVADAWVSDNVVAVRADDLGRYELAGVALAANPRTIQAVSPDGRRSGSTSVLLTVPGQVVNGADIQVSGLGSAVFQVVNAAGQPISGASVGLQGNCFHPCGCRFADTDAQGLARFADVPFGSLSARAVVPGLPGRWDSALGTAVVNDEEIAGGGIIRLEGFGTVTGVVRNPDGGLAHGASVELTTLRFASGGGVCGLQTVTLPAVYTDTQGQFSFTDVHVGAVSVRASSTAFPRVVAASSTVALQGANAAFELQLVDTMAGLLSGRILLADGSAGVGPGVEVTVAGPVPPVTVHTDAQGQYAFAAILPAGYYTLTARDTRPEGTGSVAQTRIWLQSAQTARHDLRLKARGDVRVTVVDGSGEPVEGAIVRVRLAEHDFPSNRYETTVTGAAAYPHVFQGVFEGVFSVDASDNFSRGGRASAEVPPGGQTVDVKVRLTTIGRVVGRFLWPDGVTALPLGTVRLIAGGGVVGQQTTADEGDIGSYAFDYVPAGTFRLEAFDPRSGRTGTATGQITTEGQEVTANVVAQAVGKVEGDVTLNGAPAPSAEVRLRSGPYSVSVTADGAGHYAVDGVPAGTIHATADLGGGFLQGTAQGTLVEEGETLALPVALRGAATIEGVLLAADNVSPGAPSLITLTASGARHTTTTDEQGVFRFDLVPEGNVELVADALGGIDCARQSLAVSGGETAQVVLALRGVGTLEGLAQSSAGPVGGQAVVYGTGPTCVTRQWVLAVGPSGQFRIPELIAGPVNATFTTSAPNGPTLYASATGVVEPAQTAALILNVESSGRVQGTVLHQDSSPAVGSVVVVHASGGRRATVQSGAGGSFVAEGVPTGAITIRVSDAALGGVALVTGHSVAENALLDVGPIQLLETPLGITSFTPAEGATGVAVTQPVQIVFNAPLAGAGGFSVRAPHGGISINAVLSADQKTVTLTPSPTWPDSVELIAEAGFWVTDVYGRRLAAPVQRRFSTVDLSPPKVLTVTPAKGAIQVAPGTPVAVTFHEPIVTTGDLQPLVTVSAAGVAVPGTVTSTGPMSLLFTPTAPYANDSVYTVTVNGATDLLGHVQTTAFTSTFASLDTLAPVLILTTPADAGWTSNVRPTIRVEVSDALSGADTSLAEMRLDGGRVSLSRAANYFVHTPLTELAAGLHTVEGSAHDRAGNQGVVSASFHVDAQPPSAAVITSPAADQVLAGSITLSGTATDDASGVARLQFLRGGAWIADATAANGLSTTWNTAGQPEGAHLLTARAVDVAGHVGPASAPVTVIVNNVALGVSIPSPAAGFRAANEVTVTATVTEPVARVEFRAGTGLVVTDHTAPYEALLDLSGEPEGDVVLSATAIGLAPESATATRTIFVDRTPPAPPSPTKVHAEVLDGSALILGVPGAVELGSTVDVTNTTTPATNVRVSFADGSFALRIPAAVGDILTVNATDTSGNRGGPLVITAVEAPSEATSVPTEGLEIWVRAGESVAADGGGRVSSWGDISGSGNHLVQPAFSKRPVLVTEPISGAQALRFDGVDDVLQFTNRLENNIRAVFMVVRELEPPPILRSILGDPTTTDFQGGWFSLWGNAHPSVLSGQTWLNGAPFAGVSTTRPRTLSVLSVLPNDGVTAASLLPKWKGDITELVVYSQPLTSTQRKSIEDYLIRRYAIQVPEVGAPMISPGATTFTGSIAVSLGSNTSGATTHFTTDRTEPTEESQAYAGPLVLTQTTTLKARSFRPGHIPSRSSLAGFVSANDFSPASVSGLALWTKADAGVEADTAGRVSRWRDQSSHGNDLVQPSLEAQPRVVPEAVAGLPTLRFGGGDDLLRFTSRFSGTIRAVFMVLRETPPAPLWSAILGDVGTPDFYGGHFSLWSGYTSPLILSGQTWLNGAPFDGYNNVRPQAMSVLSVLPTGGTSADRLLPLWRGDIAELIVYTEPLTEFQRKSVEDYLVLKYEVFVGTAGAPQFTPPGGHFVESVDVSITSATPGADLRYTLDGEEPTETSTAYAGPFTLTASAIVKAKAFRAGMTPSTVAVASFTRTTDFSPAAVPGLALWTRTDGGVEADAVGRVSRWNDQSGLGNDLVQSTLSAQPVVVPGVVNGLPVVRFASGDDLLHFTSRFDGTIRAVFMVLRETPPAPSWSAILGDVGTPDFYGGHFSLWSGYTSPLVLSGQTWLNGAPFDGYNNLRPQAMSVLSVLPTGGTSADRLLPLWRGDIAEFIVYTEPLTEFQRKAVEDYLALKYGVYAATAGAPTFTPPGGVFEGSVAVSITTPTPGAEIRYTLDGSEPTAASTLYEAALEITGSVTMKARAFRTGMDASVASTATFIEAADFSPSTIPGLALWTRTDAGVEADAAGRVSRWNDQSGLGHDLVQSTLDAQPVVVPGVVNGLPVVRFTSGDDLLHFTSRFDGTIRAVFMVLRETQPAPSWSAILGDQGTSDFFGGHFSLWSGYTSPLILSGQTWLNGAPFDGYNNLRPQTMSVLSVLPTGGTSADRLLPLWRGDIAELIVYTEPLTDFQRKAVEDYLNLKYAAFSGTAGRPEFAPNGATFEGTVTVSVQSPTPGAEVRYTLDGSDPTESSALYSEPFEIAATTTVRARAYRPGMNPSRFAAATFVRAGDIALPPVPGLALWARADLGVVIDEATDRVQAWRDLGGRGNDLIPLSSVEQPLLVPNGNGDRPVVRFDGIDDSVIFMDRLSTIRTVFWVVREDAEAPAGPRHLLGDANTAAFHAGDSRQLWHASESAAEVRNGETRVNGLLVNGTTTDRPAVLSVLSVITTGPVAADAFNRDRTNGRYWRGDMTELIVYERALTSVERKQVEDYLALQHGLYVPTLVAPVFTPHGSTSSDPVQVVMSSPEGADIRYTLDGSDPTESSTLYVAPFVLGARTTVKARAFRSGWNPSTAAVATFVDSLTPLPLTVPGLRLWVRADAGITAPDGFVSEWADQSGQANHLVQMVPAARPLVVNGEIAGLPAVRFDGAGDFLAFSSRETAIRTAFWVVRAAPSSLSGYRFLLGDATTFDFCSGSTSKIWDPTYTHASIRNGSTRVNGSMVDGLATDRPTAPSVISVVTTGDVNADALSRDRLLGRSWWGDVMEVALYDRPLTDTERQAIEGYLAAKYELYVPEVPAPGVSPHGGLITTSEVVALSVPLPGATVRYTTDDTEPTAASPPYTEPLEVSAATRIRARAFFPPWGPSREVVATFFDGAEAFTPASLPDLALWVRSDAKVDPGSVAAWLDQGPAGNDLRQASPLARPSTVFDVASRMPLVRFDGTADVLLFDTRLTGIRTVFWVVRDGSTGSGSRFLLGDGQEYHFSNSGTKIWDGFASVSVRNGVTRLNGAAVIGTSTDRPTALSVISLVTTGPVAANSFSRDRTIARYWLGDLGELVIYNRALTTAEVEQVEAYLAGRYGITLVTP